MGAFLWRRWPRVLILCFMAVVLRTGVGVFWEGEMACITVVDCGFHRRGAVCFGTEVRRVGAFRREVGW